jgi:glycosyltransferase involved in cell wall biosynthesis
MPAVRAYLVGAGYLEGQLRARAGERGLGEHVVFPGYRRDTRALMRQVDVVVHPPLFEGFGLSVIEAMAAGRPVVATAAPGGIPSLIADGRDGILAPVHDPPALAAALADLLADAPARERIGAAARETAERRFDAQLMCRRTHGIYEDLLR